MSDVSPNCPKCNSSHTYPDGAMWICPECFHEWSTQIETETNQSVGQSETKFLDANGVQLENGDSVSLIKDLKLGKDTLKSGTKVKNIRLLDEPVDEHDIACKIPGHGNIYLKCSVVKKVK